MLMDTRESKGGLLSNLALHAGTYLYYTYLQVLYWRLQWGYRAEILFTPWVTIAGGIQVVFVSSARFGNEIVCAYGERYAEDLIPALYAQYCAHSRVRKVLYHCHQILETLRSPSLFPLFGYRYRSRDTRRSTRTFTGVGASYCGRTALSKFVYGNLLPS